MAKVLITGVTGQVGSYMVDHLLDVTEHEIYGMVRRSSNPNNRNITHVLDNPRFHLVTGDLSDSHSIDNLVSEIKPDFFINLAAQSFVGSSWQIPEQTIDVDTLGVLRCLEAIRKHVPKCRFYNAGSSEEFGNVDYSPQDEKHPLKPRSPYGAAKAASRFIVKIYRESYNLFAIQGFLLNHESKRRGEEFVTRKITAGVAKIYWAIKNNQPFKPLELGNIDAKRDWSHAADFVRGIWTMLNQDEPKEYLLSSDTTRSVREFVELAFAAAGIEGAWTGKGKDELFYSLNGYYADGVGKLVVINPEFYRPAEVDLLLGDSTLARQDLGWEPKISFEKLVEEMVTNDILLAKPIN